MNQPNNTKKEILDEFESKFPQDLIRRSINWGIEDNPRADLRRFLTSALDRIEAETEKRVREEMTEVVGKHNARILNEFQLEGKPDMPFIAYDERVCLVPAMTKATKETLALLSKKEPHNTHH